MNPAAQRPLARLTATPALLFLSASVLAGGYVDITGGTLNPATSIPVLGTTQVLPTFNNAVFTDQLLVGAVSNDLIRTPSTADPVSTVNGNNYHDETDLAIKGRGGLNTVFTRTYNSGPSATAQNGPLGHGWSHSYAMRLKSNDHGDCPNCPAGTGAGQRPENGNGVTASITYVDERGGEHLYKVNEANQAVTAPAGEFDSLAFDTPASGQHTLTFRNGTQYVFESEAGVDLRVTPAKTARLKAIKNAWGDHLNLGYDTSAWPGHLTSVADNLGITGRTGLAFAYDANGRLDTITDWTGRVWDYTVSATGELTAYANPLNQTTAYTYHTGHLLNEVILPELRNGQASKTTFSYYRNGKTFNYKNALGHSETLDYDLYRKATRVTDPRGGIRTYAYSGDSGALEKLTEPDGAILLFENTPEGLRNKKYDAQGYATTYSYRLDRAFAGASDAGGQVTREQDALEQIVDIDYGLYDQPSRIKDKRGYQTYHDYSAATDTASGAIKGRLYKTRIGQLTVDGIVHSNVTLAEYTYHPDGTVKRQTEYLDPADAAKTRITDYAWQDNGLNLQSVTVSGGGISIATQYTWDSLGRPLSETRPRRASPTDATLTPLTSATAYDALGRIVLTTDALGHQVQTVFDGNGRVKEIWEKRKQADGSFVARRQVLR
ncbi:MAG: DUF6531 domain-containing protein, partial [Pseudomonadota bacterium]|nr:DUF6531 domain-containing protein [Pseudomonadota bacterium]